MDLTTLGIGVDSRPVDDANKRLDDFVGKAGKAEDAAKKVGDGARQGAKGFDEMEGAMTRASIKGNVIGDAIQAGVQRAIDAVKQLYSLLSQVGDFQDFADITGASAVNIAKLQTAADVAGTSMGSLTGAMNQMTRMLSQADEETDKAADALKRIGINWQEFMQLDPAERLVKLAQHMNQYGNSAAATEVKQALFGRGAAEVGKVITALGDGTKATTLLNEQLISTQDDLNDSTAELLSQTRQWIQFVLTGATPALSAFMGAIGDSVNEALGLGKASDELGQNRGIELFAIGAARLFAQVVEAGQVVYRVIEGLVSGVMTLGEAVGAVLRGDWQGVTTAFEKHANRVKEIMGRELFSQAFERNLDKYYATQVQKQYDAENKIEKAVAESTAKQDKARQKAADRAAKEAERARKAIEKELQKEKEAEEKFRMKFGREQAIEAGQAVIKANEEYQKQLEKMMELQQRADEKTIEGAQDSINAINDRAAAIEEEMRTRHMLKSAIEEEKLAVMERDRAEFEGSEIALVQLDKRIEAQKRLISAIKGQEALDATEKQAKAIDDMFDKTWDKVGQGLVDAIMRGGENAKEILKRMFKSLILEPTIRAILQGGMGAMGLGSGGGTDNIISQMIGGGGSLMNLFTNFSGSVSNTAFNAGFGLMKNGFEGLGTTLMENANMIGSATNFLGSAMGYLGALKSAKSGQWGSAIGGAAGTFFGGPIGGMVGGALGGLVDNIFGFGKKKTPDFSGAAGSYSIIGRGAGDPHRYDQQMKALLDTLDNTFKSLSTMLGGFVKDMQFGTYMIEKEGTTRWGVRAGAIGREITGSSANANAEADMKNAMADLIVDALRQSGIETDVLAYFDSISSGLTGEAKLAAVQQAAQIAQVRTALQMMSPVVSGLSTLTMQATANLAQFSGGISALSANIAAYQQNFFSATEQMAMSREMMAKTLNAPGSGWQGFTAGTLESWDKQFFRKTVEGINMTTEAGQRQFASLMSVAGAFAALEDQEEAAAAQARADAERAAAEAEARRQQAEEDARAMRELQSVITGYRYSLENFTKYGHEMIQAMVIAGAGGVRELTSALQGLMSNYSTFAERRQAVGQELAKAFRDTGESWYAHLGNPNEVMKMAREDFIQIFRTINLNTASGRKLAQEMLRLEGAFAGVTQQIREPVYYTVDSALQAINDLYNEQVGKLKELKGTLEAANRSFKDFIDSMKLDDSLSNLTPGQKMTEALNQYERAKVEMQRDNYSSESVARFTEIARSVLQQGREMYGSGQQYNSLFEQVRRDMETGQSNTSRQLSSTEKQIAALDQQVAQFKQANNTLTSIDQGIQILYSVWRGNMVVQSTPWGARGAGLYGTHADGLSYVPRDGYRAVLHQGEAVLTAKEAGFMRGLPDFVGELRMVRAELARLRAENRQDAGNLIGATFAATRSAAQMQGDATMRAANKRAYHTKSRPVVA